MKDAMGGEQENPDWRTIPDDLHYGESSELSGPRAALWALVLEARGVPCRVERGKTGWFLLVPDGLLVAALQELRLYEEENRDWPPLEPVVAPLKGNTLVTLSVLTLLATFYNVTRLDLAQFGFASVDWTGLGSAYAGRIVAGEWWRAVTALTLHADVMHLLGNLVLGGVFIIMLCRDLGSGLGWFLLLFSGIIGNMANAFVQPFYHDSIGASTLVFGAVGMLGSIRAVRHCGNLRKRWFVPVAGALSLLALLGSEGENVDLGAHLFGFVFGIALGSSSEFLVEKYGQPNRLCTMILALVAGLTPVVAWWMALAQGR